MIERIAALANRDAALLRWGRHMNDTFMVEVGDTQYLVTVRAGQIQSIEKEKLVMRSWRFAIRAPRECWESTGRTRRRRAGTTSSRCCAGAKSPLKAQAVAERVKCASFTVMKGLGHFPMSENPRGVPRLPASGAGRDPAYSTFAPDTLTTSDQRACSSRR